MAKTRKPRRWNRVLHKTVVFSGGVNESSSGVEKKPGELFQCRNYEQLGGEEPGYSSIEGTEGFDGRPSPTDETVTLLNDYGDDEYAVALLESMYSTDTSNKISGGLTFTFTGATWTTYRKKFGTGSWRFFNGVASTITIDQSSGSFDLNSNWTIDGWIQHDATLSDCVIFEKPSCIKIRIYNGDLYVDLSTNGGSSYNITLQSTNALLANRWKQISITRVGDTLLMGVDGAIEDTYDLTALTIHTNTTDIKIGDGINSNADCWVDSLRISSIARHGDAYNYTEEYEYSSISYYVFNANDRDREAARALIQAVPGADSVLGVRYFVDKAYAARAVTSGGVCGVYHSSTSGWTQDTVGFVTANVGTSSIEDDTNVPVNGEAFTAAPSGASGTVWDYVHEEGTPGSSTGQGSIILDVTSGTLAVSDVITITSTSKTATVTSIISSTLNLPDKVNFATGRFAYYPPDDPNTKSLFIFGLNTGFAGITSSGLVLYRGPSDVTAIPKFGKIFDNRLWLVYEDGYVIYSAVGDPTNFSGIAGAGEMYFGDEITNLEVSPGGNLVVVMDDTTQIVAKNEPSDATVDFPYWQKPFSSNQGAYADTAVSLLGDIYFCDHRGPTSMSRINEDSEVVLADIKRRANKTYQSNRRNIVGAYLHKEKTQYRIMFADSNAGTSKGIFMTFSQRGLKGATIVEYPHVFTCFHYDYNSNGDPIILAGAEDGFVYRLDRGTSFNGEPITTHMRTAYHHYGTPALWKRFYEIRFEISSPNRMQFFFQPDFNYSAPSVLDAVKENLTTTGEGGIWGTSVWGQFIWGGAVISNPKIYISGFGYNMAMSLITSSKYHGRHTIHNMLVGYSNGNEVM